MNKHYICYFIIIFSFLFYECKHFSHLKVWVAAARHNFKWVKGKSTYSALRGYNSEEENVTACCTQTESPIDLILCDLLPSPMSDNVLSSLTDRQKGHLEHPTDNQWLLRKPYTGRERERDL